MSDIDCKLLVIGAGPGGYVCAIRAGQLGLDTVIVDSGQLGGTCLNVGCIPSKALIHAADMFFGMGGDPRLEAIGLRCGKPALDLGKTIAWKDSIVARLNAGVGSLLKKANVRHIRGHARFLDGKTVEVEMEEGKRTIRAEAVVVATGSSPMELPGLPFGGPVISSTEALSLSELPKRLVVVGGGYIGLEIGTALAKLGSEVTVVEAADRILPQYDRALTAPVSARLNALGVDVRTSTKVAGFDKEKAGIVAETGEGERRIAADKVLVAAGRKPVTEGFGIEELRLAMDGGFIRIDERCQTSMRGVYAIGDVTGEPMLAHRAMAQGEMVAEIMAGRRRAWSQRCIPAVCFTDPEIVTAGLSPEQAKDEGLDVLVGQFPYRASGRALSMAHEDGFVRAVSRADNHVVVGAQAVGAGISELASSFALAIEMGARMEDIAGTIHAHPTMGEAFQEAALDAVKRALHA
jgi:dihydrolipoamide dehydrogenase